jgi:glycosyltransferase involved in cell wall biosynthesis
LKLLSLLPVPRLQAWTLPSNPIAPAMWRACGERWDVDIVHAAAFPYAWPILCGLRLARRNRVPFVLTPFIHLGDPCDPGDRTRRAYLAPAMRYLLHQADAIFVQTELERQAVLGCGIDEDRLILQGMGVDPAECTGGDRIGGRQRWGLAPDAVVIGHLANKSQEKGTVDLLRAAEQLWRAGRHYQVLVAGAEMPNFLRFWQHFPWKQHITNLGLLTDEQKRDFYAAIDVFALPSRSDSFGLVLLEAWANSVPCVAYRAGGVAEVVRHEEDGLLAECGDIAGLARSLDRLSADAELRQRLGESGRTRVESECQWQPRLEMVRSAYLEKVTRAGALYMALVQS